MRSSGFFIIFLLSIIFTGCKERSVNHMDNPAGIDNFSFREGQRLFIHYCSPCHGESGDGFGQYLAYGTDPEPPDFGSVDFLNRRSDTLLYLTISEGSISIGKSNLCPPWGKTFRKEEIIVMADYIKYLNAEANANNNNIELPE